MHCRSLATIISLLSFSGVRSDPSHGFGYSDEDGPNSWGDKYQQCAGQHQSPVNLEDAKVEQVELSPLVFQNFDEKPDFAKLQNNGHTVVYTIKTDSKPSVTGGPLIGKYKFEQLHFHWGAYDWEGSENTINNKRYPLEMHLVFYGASYGSFEAAMQHPDGLAVLSFMFSTTDTKNDKIKPIIDAIPSIIETSTFTNVIKPPSFDTLLPKDRTVYYTHGGSLTTPPCLEIVEWIEFTETIPIGHSQIQAFRDVKSGNGTLTHNFRPTQPLHGRIVRFNRSTRSGSTIALNSPLTSILSLIFVFLRKLIENR